MTLAEARILAAIAGDVDGGCSVCVDNVVADLNRAFLDFTWTVEGNYPSVINVTETKRPQE